MAQILKLVAVRDSKGNNFGSPGTAKTLGSAERDFQTLVNTPDTLPNRFPEDFDLYELGEFDDTTGVIKPYDTPKHIVKAVQVKQQVQ